MIILVADRVHRQRLTLARLFLLLVVFISLCVSVMAQDPGPPLPIGQVVATVSCRSNPKQSFAIYLPTNFASSRKWPVIYLFDPLARGQVAVETVRPAAEKFGYILVGSNNSRNGPNGRPAEAADAMWRDTQERFPIDEHRRYFAGMSGGARVATALAINCDGCVAGVIANAAGFDPGAVRKVGFAYFAAVGDADFNYPEFIDLRKKLEQAGAQYRIRIFAGDHGWAPPEVWMEALNWMDLRAMATGTLSRDERRIVETRDRELERAGLQSHRDLLAGFHEYQSIVRGFDGLSDISGAKLEVEKLGKDKSLRKAEKAEAEAASLQAKLTGKASAQLEAIANDALADTDFNEAREAISNLSRQAQRSPTSNSKTLVLRRALGQLVVEAFELGQRSMEEKKYASALQYFDLAGVGSKHPEWAHYYRARAYALMSDRKKMLAELRLAIAGGVDDASALEADEFQPYRAQPEFEALMSQLKIKAPH